MNRALKLIEKLLSVDHSDDENLDHVDYSKHSDADKVQHVHDELTREAKEHVGDLSSFTRDHPHKAALNEYTVSSYEPINNHLRKGDPIGDYSKKYIEPLKELTHNKTKHTFNLYRTMKSDVAGNERGSMFQDKGFTSASLRPSMASRFKDNGTRNYRIRVRPGTRGHYAGDNSAFKFEKEFILHPGTKFKVGKTFTHPNGQQYTDLHIHSQADEQHHDPEEKFSIEKHSPNEDHKFILNHYKQKGYSDKQIKDAHDAMISNYDGSAYKDEVRYIKGE